MYRKKVTVVSREKERDRKRKRIRRVKERKNVKERKIDIEKEGNDR
jgi:hypothetical protein